MADQGADKMINKQEGSVFEEYPDETSAYGETDQPGITDEIMGGYSISDMMRDRP